MSRRWTLGKADLRDGELRGFKVASSWVVVARSGDRYWALDDWCNHAGCLLSKGRLDGTTLICPCHEIGFDLATGRNRTSPELAGDQAIYQVEVVDGSLVVSGLPDRP